jgi:actin-related protein 7
MKVSPERMMFGGVPHLCLCVAWLQLGWVAGEEGNLLLADPVATSRPDRERMAGLMFETFNAASYFVSDQAVLSLYAVGKMSGTVVDIGAQTIGKHPTAQAACLRAKDLSC